MVVRYLTFESYLVKYVGFGSRVGFTTGYYSTKRVSGNKSFSTETGKPKVIRKG